MSAIGYVVGEARTTEFTFVTNPKIAPPRLEYVVIKDIKGLVEGEERDVDVLAQVSSLAVSSRLYDTSMTYTEVESILRRLGSSPPVIVGTAKVLGYLDGNVVRYPRRAPMPGTDVYLAPNDLLQRFFSHEVALGIEIGTLINRPQVSVLLDPNGLRRHLAVIAQTGAGKSYTVGLILEGLLGMGATIITFDPNSDYVLMRRDKHKQPTPFANCVQVYRLPTEQEGRISDKQIGGTRRFTVQFSQLDPEEICAMTGISQKASRIRSALRTACENLEGTDYTPTQLLRALEQLAQGARPGAGPEATVHPAIGDAERVRELVEERMGVDFGSRQSKGQKRARPAPPAKRITRDLMSGAQGALKYIERLERVDIWGFRDVPMSELLKPMSMSVIDLAGVDQWIAEFVVNKVLQGIWSRATIEGLNNPVFVVLEEAHDFVPGGRYVRSQCAPIIKRLASEGRKFGIFLVLITQRPYRIHQDTLSQCNSQLIMRLTNPEDQSAVRRASERISEDLLSDLPGLNVGEAVVLGPLVRVPVMVKVGERVSQEGGSDIDVIKALKRARSEAVTEEMEKAAKERSAAERGEWKEEV